MALFSCYVEVERFLGEPVKELVKFLICLSRRKKIKVLTKLAEFFQFVDHIGQFYKFKNERKDQFLSSLPLSSSEKKELWKLTENFFLRHSENSSGKPIPQDDLIALRKGRLFEELVFHIGPIKKWKVELVSMHCQPMINRKKLDIFCGDRLLSGKNLDVAFWGRDYVEGYECKGNVEFFISLGLKHGEKARKVREKTYYLNQLAVTLKRYMREVKIYLASFAIDIDLEFVHSTINRWVKACNEEVHFEVITVKDFLERVKPL